MITKIWSFFSKYSNWFKHIANCFFIFLMVVLAVFLLSLLPINKIYKFHIVATGSMEPEINAGSVIMSLPQNSYQIGDVITYFGGKEGKSTITHRIVSVDDQDGMSLYTTKGDANNANDVSGVTEDRVLGKVILSIPYFGYIVGFTRTLPGLIIIVGIAAIIAYEEMKNIHHETKHIIRKRREKKESDKLSKKKAATNPRVGSKNKSIK